jgi:hypothetical protein
VFDLSPTEWHLIDAFEDDIYRLDRITLKSQGACWTYVYDGSAASLDRGRPWDRSAFADRHLDAYVQRCAAWRTSHLIA